MRQKLDVLHTLEKGQTEDTSAYISMILGKTLVELLQVLFWKAVYQRHASIHAKFPSQVYIRMHIHGTRKYFRNIQGFTETGALDDNPGRQISEFGSLPKLKLIRNGNFRLPYASYLS